MLAFLDRISFGTPFTRRLVFGLTCAFIAYVVIGFFILPPVAKTIIIEQSAMALKRKTTVDEIAFNPLTLGVEVKGVKVSKLKGEGDLLTIGSFSASPGLASIWKLAPVVSHLHLRDLTLDVTFFGEGQYSVSDLIGAKSEDKKQDSEPMKEEEGEVFPFALYGFEMTNATIVFDDRPRDKKHVISDLDLMVPFTSSFFDLRKQFTQPRFSAVINGDPVQLKGRTLPFDETMLTEFQLGAVEIDLEQYWRYLPVTTNLRLEKGSFTSDLSLYFERPDAKRVTLFIGGGGTLTDLALSAPDEGTVLALEKLNFEMERYSLGDNHLIMKKVLFDQPYFKVARNGRNVINWAEYFPGQEAVKPKIKEEAPEKGNPVTLNIEILEIREGSLDWHDKAVPGGFRHKYAGFAFKGENISTKGDEPSRFKLSLGKKLLITANGQATLQPMTAKAHLTVKGLELARHKPYLDQALPLSVDSGTAGLSADLDFRQQKDGPLLTVANGNASLNNLVLRKPEAEKPSLSLKKLAVNGASMNLAERNVLVDEVRLNGPDVTLVHLKSGLDLAELFNDKTKDEQERNAESPSWTATVNKVRVKDGTFSYHDLALRHPATLSVNSLKADIDNLTTREGESAQYAVSARWGRRGTVSLEGSLGITPLESKGRIKVRGMPLRPFDGHLAQHTELLFASGTAYTDLGYVFTGDDEPKINVNGNVSLHQIRLKDNRGLGEFAGVDKFTLGGIRFSNAPYRLSIADISLNGPRAAIHFDEKGELNVRRIFRIEEPEQAVEEKPTPKTPATQKAETAPRPAPSDGFFKTLDIGKVSMNDGSLIFQDATVSPEYITRLTNMKLTLLEIAQSPDARPKLNFSANIGPTPFSVTGVLNPVVTPMYSDLSVSVNGMELVSLTPYTVEYLAYPIEKGRLYADVTFNTEDWVLTADNKFYIEQLVLGPKDKRPDAPKVPVKFGLALLQDGDGNLELNLPIRGRLDDPDFQIGGIVFRAIASLFVKALASPFSLIGSIFEGGGENMDFVLFRPGRHGLDQSGKQKLATTIKALKERDRLDLEVDGVIDPVDDRRGLIQVIFENKLKQQKYESLSRKERAETTVDAMVIHPDEYEKYLFEAYKDEPDEEGVRPTTLFMVDRQPVSYMEKFIIDRIEVTDDDLNELAMRRARAVKKHIIDREPDLTERVFLLDRREDKVGKTGVPRHRADLGIK